MDQKEEVEEIGMVKIMHDGGATKEYEFKSINLGGKIALKRTLGVSLDFWLSSGEGVRAKSWFICEEDLLKIQAYAHDKGVKFKARKRQGIADTRVKKQREPKKRDPKQEALFPSWMLGDKE